MIQTINPYSTPAFRRTTVRPNTEALLRGFAERDRQEAISGARGIIFGGMASVCFWIALAIAWSHR